MAAWVSKDAARIDWWFKDIAPSTSLRKWFDHDPEKWSEFSDRYLLELRHNADAVEQLAEHVRRGPVTLVYGAKDQEHAHALVLRAHLENLT